MSGLRHPVAGWVAERQHNFGWPCWSSQLQQSWPTLELSELVCNEIDGGVHFVSAHRLHLTRASATEPEWGGAHAMTPRFGQNLDEIFVHAQRQSGEGPYFCLFLQFGIVISNYKYDERDP